MAQSIQSLQKTTKEHTGAMRATNGNIVDLKDSVTKLHNAHRNLHQASDDAAEDITNQLARIDRRQMRQPVDRHRFEEADLPAPIQIQRDMPNPVTTNHTSRSPTRYHPRTPMIPDWPPGSPPLNGN